MEFTTLTSLFTTARDLEDAHALESEKSSVVAALAEQLCPEDQVALSACGWNGSSFVRSISASELQELITGPPETSTVPPPRVSGPILASVKRDNKSDTEHNKKGKHSEDATLTLSYGYSAPPEFDVDFTFTSAGHVIQWVKEQGLFPKKGSATRWNWFFDVLLGEDAGPKNRDAIIPKEHINDILQRMRYPVDVRHQARTEKEPGTSHK